MKSYNEIAENIFKRREEYIIKRRKKRTIILSIFASLICGCIVLTTSYNVLNKVFLNNSILIINKSNDKSAPQDNLPVTPSDKTPQTPQNDENGFLIDSIDKMNFYSAKKIINENMLLPMGMSIKNNCAPKVSFLNNIYVEYPIGRDEIFTITMVTYFTIELNDEKGFLAQKLGGTGLVEVVVTENDIDQSGQMITFKREDKYYTCLMNGAEYDTESNRASRHFSSHIYIDGFNIVKNFNQENFEFTVHYEGTNVVGFETAPYDCKPTKYTVDNTTLTKDYCVVLFTKQYFTIDQLEVYFNKEEG